MGIREIHRLILRRLMDQNNLRLRQRLLAPTNTVDSQSVLKRLQSELMGLMMGSGPGISAFPEEDNIFCWKGTITGSKDTVFEGTEYRLSLSFSNDYPFKPPKVKFETCCFHPNVDVYGNICLDILQAEPRHVDVLGQLLHASKIVAEKEGILDGSVWLSTTALKPANPFTIFICTSSEADR